MSVNIFWTSGVPTVEKPASAAAGSEGSVDLEEIEQKFHL